MKMYQDISYLLGKLVSGDNDAWVHFLQHYGRFIYHCINKIMGYTAYQEDKDECFEEIIKAMIEDDYRRLKQVRSHEEKVFRSWLGSVTTRRAINFIRVKKEINSLPEEMFELIPDKGAVPDMTVFLSQIIDYIEGQLNPKEGLVLSYLLEGLNLEEIAKIMGYGITTIYNIKENAFSALRNFINSSGTGEKN
ncbi:sigma-70 family RNA polymerase sigma factor [bacterium]|nr:sigma-70 family RNA polymerase sigma factor [bacterium]